MTEQFKCQRCLFVWNDRPGVLGACYSRGCSRCGSLYWKWLTFDPKKVKT